MTPTRRHLLHGIAYIPLIAAACTATNGLLSPATINQATTFANALPGILADIQAAFPGVLSTQTLTSIDSAIGSAINDATELAGIVAATGSTPSFAKLVSAGSQVINMIVAALPAGVIPGQVALGLQAATLLAQTLAALVPPGPTVGAVRLNTRFMPAGMTVDQAVGVLAGKVGRKHA